METQYTRLSMTPSGVPPVIYMSQNDIGRPIGFICDADLSDYSVVLEGTRTDGTPITVAVTVDGNICAFETTATMTNKADVYIAQIVVTNASGKHISSIPIKCVVVLAAMDENSEGIEEDAPLYQQYTGTVQSLIADIRTQLNAETAARQAADNQLQSNINAEASTRATQDASLQSQINQLIAPSGEAPSAAEVENARVGADGTVYPTLGDAIRTQDTQLKSVLTNNFNGLVYGATAFDFAAGTAHLSLTDQIILELVPNQDYVFLFESTNANYAYFMQMYGFYKDGTTGIIKSATIQSGTEVGFVVTKATEKIGFAVSPSNEASGALRYQVYAKDSFIKAYKYANVAYYSVYIRPPITFEIGYWHGNTGEALVNPNARSKDFYPFMPTLTFQYVGIKYNVLLYDVSKTFLGSTGWNNTDKNYSELISEYPSAFYFKLNLQYAYSDDMNAEPDEWLVIRCDAVAYNTSITSYFLSSYVPDTRNGYFIGPSTIMQPLKSTQVGYLPYIQGFCKYNSHYYSTNGSKIDELDETLTLVRSVDASVGHGNSFQIGADGFGYISGWNDDSVYKVNMSTLSVVETITLPVSGYTTVAVDTLNGLMYIFWRTDYPDTTANYMVTIWDYINDIVIKTTKTPIAFGAMQGCDYYNGLVYVSYGLGTSAVPSGIDVYDTSVGVVGRFKLDALNSVEPEGICIDRDTGKMYFSDVATKLYRIE